MRKLKWLGVGLLAFVAATYAFQNCAQPNQISAQDSQTGTVSLPNTCTLSTLTLNSGDSVPGYASPAVPYGQTCTATSITCTEGVLSPSSASLTCAVATATDLPCPHNGNSYPSGTVLQTYASASVPYGSTCAATAVTCNNGNWSAAFANDSCSPATCGGTPLAGACWYLALGTNVQGNQSCDDECSTHGGSNAATVNYAGTGGSYANCQSVLLALGLDQGVYDTHVSGANACSNVGVGCSGTSAQLAGLPGGGSDPVWLWCNGAPTTTAAAKPYYLRACACNQ